MMAYNSLHKGKPKASKTDEFCCCCKFPFIFRIYVILKLSKSRKRQKPIQKVLILSEKIWISQHKWKAKWGPELKILHSKHCRCPLLSHNMILMVAILMVFLTPTFGTWRWQSPSLLRTLWEPASEQSAWRWQRWTSSWHSWGGLGGYYGDKDGRDDYDGDKSEIAGGLGDIVTKFLSYYFK